MPNRSYLYTSDSYPAGSSTTMEFVGVAEFEEDIPLVFKLLLSGKTKGCHSWIWHQAGHVALCGNFDLGVEKLIEFMGLIEAPEAQEVLKESLEFLQDAGNKRKYFLLEPGEIYVEKNRDMEELNQDLKKDILGIDSSIDTIARSVSNELKGEESSTARAEIVKNLDFGSWSNDLRFLANSIIDEAEYEEELDPNVLSRDEVPEALIQFWVSLKGAFEAGPTSGILAMFHSDEKIDKEKEERIHRVLGLNSVGSCSVAKLSVATPARYGLRVEGCPTYIIRIMCSDNPYEGASGITWDSAHDVRAGVVEENGQYYLRLLQW